MPADFTEYVDLSIFDKEPGEIYLDAIELARLSLPDFNLRIGTPEDAMFQAAAYISALNINAINRLPDRLMAGIVAILGYQRQDAIPAEVDVEIVLGDYDGGTIPAGTVFVYDSVFEDEVQQFAFQLTSALTLDATDLEVSTDYPSAIATVTCLDAGVIPPLTPGVELNVLSSGTDIVSVTVASPSNFANGINADIDSEYLSKASTYLRSLTSALVRPSQIDSYILTQYPGIVNRVKTYDLTNGDSDGGNITVKRSAGIIETFMSSGTATIETAEPHLFVVDDVVELEIFNASVSATYMGSGVTVQHSITEVPTDTTFKFVYGTANSASTAVTGSAYAGKDATGYVSIVVYGSNTELTFNEKESIATDVRSKATAGLVFEVIDPTIVTLQITGSIALDDSYDQDALQDLIESTLVDYLSPSRFPLSYDRIRLSQIITLISNIPGVVYVDSLNMVPTGSGWLPKHGDDLLFLNKGTLPVLGFDDITFSYSSVSTAV